ncbi:DUF2550 domain-containing protein [Actinomyces bowdenii]|uniref:DUF2550 family protein n=1 Tax=Actinomyces bowdenii TaxID=131109 RepID=A0A3P1V8U1_9ACTO|nr:DUF2550 family protein [Actinomyces bowdenii]MBO3724806.1 DUF2550 domain-containing protein [Actinomyces bowdenii]RRD30632.1 DUF2550 family protein [Actinomyces bowdenii]
MGMHAWAIVVTAIGAIVLLIAAFLIRLRFLAGQVGSFECAWRSSGGSRWFSGVAAFRHDSLDWYRLISLSLRPTRSWCRLELELRSARRRRADSRVIDLECAQVPQDPMDSSRVPHTFELAMMEESHSALVAWVESASPQQPRLF